MNELDLEKRPSPDWQRAAPTGTVFQTGSINELRGSFSTRFPLLDRVLRVLPASAIVAGGVFADMLRGREPHDIDIFFSDLSVVPQVQDTLRRFEDFDAVFFGQTSSLLRSRSTKITLNLLHSVAFSDSSALLDRFDLSPTQVAVTPDGRIAYNSVGVEDTLAAKMKLHRPQASILTRLTKYRVKGFEVNDELIDTALKYGGSVYKYEQYKLVRDHAKQYGLEVKEPGPELVVPVNPNLEPGKSW